MKKYSKYLKGFAIVLGVVSILVGLTQDLDFSGRIVVILVGILLIALATSYVFRNSLLSLVFLGSAIASLGLIVDDSGTFDIAGLFTVLFCLGLGVYFGEKVIRNIQVLKHPHQAITDSPDVDSVPDFEVEQFTADPPPCEPSTQGNNQISEPLIDYSLVEFIVDHLNRDSTVAIPLAPKPDVRDDFAKYGGASAEMLTIDLMEGHDFEYWCANILEDMGFTDVQVTPGSGDQGVDILATQNNIKYAIQCKRYSSDLGNTPVQEVHAGKYIYHCHVAAVITNRHFTNSAKELADATGVLLWDRDWIEHYLKSKSNEDGSILISHSTNSNSIVTSSETTYDDMIPAAINVILETGQASVSILQRKLCLGYARCARIINEMEELGIVGPFRDSQPRLIYLTKAEWDIIRTQLKNI